MGPATTLHASHHQSPLKAAKPNVTSRHNVTVTTGLRSTRPQGCHCLPACSLSGSPAAACRLPPPLPRGRLGLPAKPATASACRQAACRRHRLSLSLHRPSATHAVTAQISQFSCLSRPAEQAQSGWLPPKPGHCLCHSLPAACRCLPPPPACRVCLSLSLSLFHCQPASLACCLPACHSLPLLTTPQHCSLPAFLSAAFRCHRLSWLAGHTVTSLLITLSFSFSTRQGCHKRCRHCRRLPSPAVTGCRLPVTVSSLLLRHVMPKACLQPACRRSLPGFNTAAAAAVTVTGHYQSCHVVTACQEEGSPGFSQPPPLPSTLHTC